MDGFPDKIIIVDDEPAHVEAIRRAIAGMYPSCDIRDTGSLEGYRHLLSEFKPDILLIDLNLPDGRAVEVLKSPPEECAFPVLIMTSYGSERTAVEAMKAGAVDYMVKSHDTFSEITRLIERTIREWTLITGKARAILELKQSEELFRLIAENSQDIFLLIDPRTMDFEYVSPSFEKIFGASCETIYANPLSLTEMVHPEDAAMADRYFKNGVKPGINTELRMIIPGIGLRWIWVRTFPIYNETGVIHHILGVASDISDRKEVEEQHLVIHKLESIGVLAGGIAHDFNNLLTVVMGNISLAKTFTAMESRIYRLLDNTETATVRAADLTKKLITFAKGGAPVLAPIYINSLFEDIVSLSLAGSNVGFSIRLSNDLWPVMADTGQLRQVFQNIIINAREAMPEGGTIIISAGNLESAGNLPLQEKEKYVRITIQDNGPGIQPEKLKHIFDPYFSTKAMGSDKGTGLGLAVAYSITAKHRGLLTVESSFGEGAAFHIYLPAAKITHSVPGKGGFRILFMDDELLIAMTAEQILKSAGYDVTTAHNGSDAVDIYIEAIRSGNPFDIIILDLTVPGGMGGVETLRTIFEIDPSVQAIVISGYLNDPVMSNYSEYGFKAALTKPFSNEDLIGVVSRNLQSADRGLQNN